MPSVYVTSQGDAWDAIARRVYGDERHLHLLLAANPDHAGTLLFGAGTPLAVPDAPARAASEDLPPWKR